jgi:hypothetical protein
MLMWLWHCVSYNHPKTTARIWSSYVYFLPQTRTFITQVYFDILFYFIFLYHLVVFVNLMFYFILHLNFQYHPPRLVHFLLLPPIVLPLCLIIHYLQYHTYLIYLILTHGCLTSKMKALWSGNWHPMTVTSHKTSIFSNMFVTVSCKLQ